MSRDELYKGSEATPVPRTLDYEGSARDLSGNVWWYFRASDTGVLLGVKNARQYLEWDVDDDGNGSARRAWEYAALWVCEHVPTLLGIAFPGRPATGEEEDEYTSDLHAALRRMPS